MFIYKITNIENSLCYVGLDTHAEYRQKRWKDHKRDCGKIDSKFYKALRGNIDKFSYDVIYRTMDIGDLLTKEIEYIAEFDSYKNGYNSSPGGDAFYHRDLKNITTELYDKIISIKREWAIELNKKKWEDTLPEERKVLCKHLHTPEINEARADTLRQYYQVNPEAKKHKGRAIKLWQENNKELVKETNKKNGLKGAEKVSKKVKIEFQDGSIKIYNSKSEFNREHGEIINAILRKTKDNNSHRGFKGWEI
jgi:hypothetical protein